MIRYSLWFLWTASRGYRFRPWQSPFLRWRIETYSGLHAEQITFMSFWRFTWQERESLKRFLRWGAEMKHIERRMWREANSRRD
jgi:hypothetical protein